jgi:cytochrome P450/NADPH-cytochrome P450 reductase
MSTDNTTSLIVVLKGSTDVENDGRIIRFGNGANLDTIRGLAAEKLSIAGGIADIQLLNEKGEILGGIDALRNQQVVYVDLKQHIKDVIPGPSCLPFVGSLYEMLPNM